MSHRGDFDASAIVYGKFSTYRPSTGAAFALGGSAALSVYKDNSTTQSTTGVTLTVDFDSVTGLNHFTIDTSADGTFYSAGSEFDIVITTGTVDGVSVVGSVVGSFSIRKSSSLKPTTAGRSLDVSAGGEAGLDWANIGSPTTAQNLSATNIDVDQVVASVSGAVGSVTGAVGSVTGAVGSVTGNVGGNVTGSVGSVAAGGIADASFATTAGPFASLGVIDQGTAQAATGTTLQLRAGATFADDEPIGSVIQITGGSTGVGQSRTITDYVSATDTATVDAWTTTPTGTITYKVWASPPLPLALPAVNVTQISGDSTAADNAEAFFDGTGYAGTNNVIPTVTNLTNAPTAGDLTATMKASVNAEVVDALNVDTYAEPGQGAPAATTSLAAKINYLFKFLRNKYTQDATTFKVFADDGTTVDHKSTVSDDGTTLTRGEIATGP